MLRSKQDVDRLATGSRLVLGQHHRRVASRLNRRASAKSTRPSAAAQHARFNLGLNVLEKGHKENEDFQTENLSKYPHTYYGHFTCSEFERGA